MSSVKTDDRILICGFNPYFLEKSDFWFQEHESRVIVAAKKESFFQDNTLVCEKNQIQYSSQFLRRLDELGYEKVLCATQPGEFSRRGGIIDVFPINLKCALRIEFMGNHIENIELLPPEISNGEELRRKLLRRLKRQKAYIDLSGLKAGDYLVHLDHGIGKYAGNILMNDKNYYLLEYAGEDKLYVPGGLERKLSRYVGFSEPKISRLSSPLWGRTKKKIKEETEKLAKELLALYAEKETTKRRIYATDTILARDVTAGFPFEETPDQIQAMEDIKKDLSGEKPMDRIVCGDVGFGKTEIALRSAVMAAESGYQTAFICPTTILAHQHYQNFTERLKNLPIEVELLCRLQTKRHQKNIIDKIMGGQTDIVIGTHRLLSNDVVFKNLGLIILDDEQRFGVGQKEKLRQLKTSLDVLSLSATPIPRTLYLAMSSLKTMSVIQTPPPNRFPVKTFVLPFTKKTILKAISLELKRNGQVYYLHNRIENIAAIKKIIGDLNAEAKISVVHGRLQEKELIAVMKDFRRGKMNILLATTIIENGIDIENANTLIVADATKLGLAQMHQIRGRIGRSQKQAFAYFLYPQRFQKKNMPDLARQRLEALKEAQELGSGWQIALKDLELRGAGNILGKEQSGNINQVGLNLYCQMLSEAIDKLKGRNPAKIL